MAQNKAMYNPKKITSGTAIYGVKYETATGGINQIPVKARNRAEAEKNAKNIVKTGKNFKAV